MAKKIKSFKTVKDEDVLSVWKCPNCKDTTAVRCSWYQDMGTPVCYNCDENMIFDHVEVRS